MSKWRAINTSNGWIVVNEQGENIAIASYAYPECVIGLNEKDAHLIASAPGLLEALNYAKESLYCILDEMPFNPSEPREKYLTIISKLEQAISQAEPK